MHAANTDKAFNKFFKKHLKSLLDDKNVNSNYRNNQRIKEEYDYLKKCYSRGLLILSNIKPGYEMACTTLFRKQHIWEDPDELQISFWGNVESVLPRWFDCYDDVELVISAFEGASNNAST